MTTTAKRWVWISCLCVLAFGCGGRAATRGSDGGSDTSLGSDDADATGDVSLDVTQATDGETMADATPDAMPDATGMDSRATTDARAGDAFGSGVRLCSGQAAVVGPGYCRTQADCGPIGPSVCSIGLYDWGPQGCPLPPGSQPCPNECTTDSECAARAGGKCDPYTRTCPRCNGHVCRYPPPPCTPSSCSTGDRCRSDGACEPIPCNEGGSCGTSYRCSPTAAKADNRGCEPVPCDSGHACPSGTRCNPGSARADLFGCELTPCDGGYACPAGARCNVGSSRADQHGCEYTPCSDGFMCLENTRCTVSAPAAYDHGCTTMTCTSDADCDCGYCVKGACSAVPGTCQFPPA
jgi:hypothetical protein